MTLPDTSMSAPMMEHHIDYEYGKAILYSVVEPQKALSRFHTLAGDCFGIRKSIGETTLLASKPSALPTEYKRYRTACEILMHHDDVIIWNFKGKKIKSEWD